MDRQKAERVPFRNNIQNFRSFTNLRLENEDPLCCCSVQEQNSAATSIIEIPCFLNHLADRVV
jgi:hypothetical protein